jgi:hypothetical protein
VASVQPCHFPSSGALLSIWMGIQCLIHSTLWFSALRKGEAGERRPNPGFLPAECCGGLGGPVQDWLGVC